VITKYSIIIITAKPQQQQGLQPLEQENQEAD
jgi:hypothetical protein